MSDLHKKPSGNSDLQPYCWFIIKPNSHTEINGLFPISHNIFHRFSSNSIYFRQNSVSFYYQPFWSLIKLISLVAINECFHVSRIQFHGLYWDGRVPRKVVGNPDFHAYWSIIKPALHEATTCFTVRSTGIFIPKSAVAIIIIKALLMWL
jgi:hypothetical protein